MISYTDGRESRQNRVVAPERRVLKRMDFRALNQFTAE
jgi:hypothetical protein